VWGNYLAGVFPVLYIVFLAAQNKILKKISTFLLVFCIVFILISFARAAWISTLISFLLISFHLTPRFRILFNRQNKLILGAGIFFFFLFLICLKYRSFVGRLLIYKTCFNIMLNNPWGTGSGTFQSVFHVFQADYFKNNFNDYNDEWFAADSIRIGYNEYVECFVELGIIGFLIILSIAYRISKIFYDVIRFPIDILSFSLMCSIIGFGIVALFSYPLMEKPICLYLVISLGYLSAKFEKKITMSSLNFNKISWFILLSLCATTTILTIQKQLYYFKFSLLADTTIRGDFDIKGYESIYSNIDDNSRFLNHYGGELMKNGHYGRSIQVLETAKKSTIDEKMLCFLAESYYKKGNNIEAEKNFLLAVYVVPSRFFPKYFLMNFYEKTNKIDEAKKWANIIINMPVKLESSEVYQIKKEANRLLKYN
jgi:O-antigen polymerase